MDSGSAARAGTAHQRSGGLTRKIATAVCFIAVNALVSVSAQAGNAEPLSVQGCNTRCQTAQTDCALRCDGDIPCIQNCQKTADSCVDKCQAPH